MPESMRRLASLECLYLFCSRWIETDINSLDATKCKFLSLLLQHCSLLCKLTMNTDNFQKAIKNATPYQEKLLYDLACNRSRHRSRFGIPGAKSIHVMPKLWPHLLNRAASSFEWNFVASPDAIYQLLLDGRESFVRTLLVVTTSR